MATPRDIIDSVLEDLERPDFQVKAEKEFYSALKAAHGIALFQRDLKSKLVTTITYSAANAQTSIPLPAGIREIHKFRFWQTYTTVPSNEILQEAKFKNAILDAALTDYYGFKEQYTYFIRGNELILSGLPEQVAAINVTAIYWPTFVFDSLAGDYVSDSWILQEYSSVVRAYLFLALSRKQSNNDIKASAAAFWQEQYNSFLTTYSRETICLA